MYHSDWAFTDIDVAPAVSPDGEKWETIHRGAFGNIINDPGRRIETFNHDHDIRFFRLSNLQAPGGINRVGAADIELLPADNN